MSIEKMQLKALMAEGIGRDLEKDMNSAQIKVYKYQGAQDALQQACKTLGELAAKTRDELFDGEIKLDPEDPMATAKFVVARLQAGVAKLHEMAEVAKTSSIKADGERAGIEHAVLSVKKIFDTENSKIAAIRQKLESGEIIVEDGDRPEPRPTGTHPGPTLKMQRQEKASRGNGVKKPTRRKKAKSEALDAGNT